MSDADGIDHPPIKPARKRVRAPSQAIPRRAAFKTTTPQEAARLKFLVHGESNAGKTRLLGTAQLDERTAPTLFLAFEAGLQTLVGLDVAVKVVNDWQDYNDAYEELSRPGTPWKSVCVDSLSETQIAGLLHILDKSGPTQRADRDQLSESDWGVILVQMRRFVREFKALDMHVFMSALSKPVTNVRAGRQMAPLFSGSFAEEVNGVFDVVGFLEEVRPAEKKAYRVLRLQGDPKYRTKVRTPWDGEAPDRIARPTVTKLMDALGYK